MAALKKLGFDHVYEVAKGADICHPVDQRKAEHSRYQKTTDLNCLALQSFDLSKCDFPTFWIT